MRWSFGYYAPDGRYWDLSAVDGDRVFLVENGLTGFAADSADVTVQRVGRDGVVHLPRQSRLQPMSGSLEVGVYSPSGGVGGVWHDWLRSWSRLRHGWLVADPGGGAPQVWCRVRLAAPMPAPVAQPEAASFMRVAFDVVNDDGCAWYKHQQVGPSVQVTNYGVVPVFPRVVWSTGGVVKLPSGVSFTLPTVSATRVVELDVGESFVVKDLAGKVDKAVWAHVCQTAFAEPVMPGKQGTFTVPSGAVMHWDVGVETIWG